MERGTPTIVHGTGGSYGNGRAIPIAGLIGGQSASLPFFSLELQVKGANFNFIIG
jgi:hypothetical protein